MASGKKGYWIVHLVKIHDEGAFFAHLKKANEGTKYGGLTRLFAPVKETLAGEPVQIIPDGPGSEKQPQVEADRKARLIGFVEFNKTFTGG